MICKGKRAEVLGCKKAETVEPVNAVIHSKLLQREKKAVVTQVNIMKQQKAAVVVEVSPLTRERDADVKTPQESNVIPREMSCRSVSSDITLKKLFLV